jgi:hypothetical protein
MDVKSGSMILRIAVALFGLSILCSCALVPEPQITSLLDVPPDKTVIVGRIELHLPLSKEERMSGTIHGEELKNGFILYCGDRQRNLDAIKPDDYAGSFATILDKDFYIKTDTGITLYVTGGTFYTADDLPNRVIYHTFSSPFQVDLRPDDKAVYIGTIQYYRDDANNLTSVMIRDAYDWADSQFKERFGTNNSLRKSLLTLSHAVTK